MNRIFERYCALSKGAEYVKEADLFEPLRSFLFEEMLCEQVYAEVNDLDVVGKHGNVYIGIEMKTSLNFKVIEQAVNRKSLVDYMFILVPRPKNPHRYFVLNWLKQLDIGLMYYDDERHRRTIVIQHWGKRQRSSKRYKIADYINDEIHLVNVGGSKGGETLTTYKLTIDKIKAHLYFSNDWQSIEDILSKVETHYSNPKPSTMATLRAHWNQDWIEYQLIGNKQHYRMKEEYREKYWEEFRENLLDIRQR